MKKRDNSKRDKTVIMGFGTFDALHPGHSFYLNELKKLGDWLIVIIARDKNVKKIKGISTHFKENERLKAVENLKIADRVILGNDSDFYEVIHTHKPDILGFGYDQRVDIEAVKKTFPQIEIKRVEAYHPEKFKSSIIKKGLKNKN